MTGERPVLLDTSVLIDVLRGEPEAVAFLASLPSVPACSEITRIEVTRGLRSRERRPAARLLASLAWVTVDSEVAERAGELGRRWRRSHPGIATADLAIAASAELREAELATANIRHFPMFDGLKRPSNKPRQEPPPRRDPSAMWITTTQGFYSVVEDRTDPDRLIVRARTAGDIEALRRQIPSLEPFEDPGADYRHRAIVRREEWIAALALLAMDVDYDNFKSAVAERQGHERAGVYARVWSALLALQRG